MSTPYLSTNQYFSIISLNFCHQCQITYISHPLHLHCRSHNTVILFFLFSIHPNPSPSPPQTPSLKKRYKIYFPIFFFNNHSILPSHSISYICVFVRACVCVCVFSRQALMQDLHVGERPLCRILYLCRIFSVLHKSTEN